MLVNREAIRLLGTLFASFVIAYYLGRAGIFWIPLATLLVMQTPIGAHVTQGLKIYLLLLLVVVSVTLLLEPLNQNLLMTRCQDLTVGALIGILSKHFILPTPPEIMFRNSIFPIVSQSKAYFCVLMNSLHKSTLKSSILQKRAELEEKIAHLPSWVFASELNKFFQSGFKNFIIKMEESIMILFMMQKSISVPLNPDLIKLFKNDFEKYKAETVILYDGILAVLELRQPSALISDLTTEMENIFATFKQNISFSTEWGVLSEDILEFTNFIYLLNDLHKALQSLGQSLSSEVATGRSAIDFSLGNKSLSPHSDHEPS